MKLIGYRFREGLGPLSEGTVQMNSFTVLLGANDVGKSSLLATFVRDLQAMQWPHVDGDGPDAFGSLPWTSLRPCFLI